MKVLSARGVSILPSVSIAYILTKRPLLLNSATSGSMAGTPILAGGPINTLELPQCSTFIAAIRGATTRSRHVGKCRGYSSQSNPTVARADDCTLERGDQRLDSPNVFGLAQCSRHPPLHVRILVL